MQRAYCAALTDPLAVDRQELLDCKRRIYLSGIQERLPNISVPQDTVLDNTEVQRIKSAVAEELPGDRWSRNPLERRFCYQLQSCLADDLCATRNPVEAWTSPHAHWLDRIARIEKLLGTNDLARFAGQAVYPYNVRRAYANPSRYAAGLPVYFKPNAHTHAVLCHHRRTYFHWA